MSQITDLRRDLREIVEPVLGEGDLCEITAAPSDYKGNLASLRFQVRVTISPSPATQRDPADVVERLDELLEPVGGIKAAIEAGGLGAQVTRSSGHQTFPDDRVGATWTCEVLR